MTDTHETVVDIIAEMRRGFDQSWHDIDREWVHGLADRLEAAHKREVDKLNSVIQATVSHSDAEIDRLRREIAELKQAGDCAKLREACAKAAESAAEIMERVRHKDGLAFNTANYIAGIAKAALAEPPRNCDVLELKEGRPGDIADQVWRAYRQSHMGSYLDVCDLLRCIGWLFAPATEREGGAK